MAELPKQPQRGDDILTAFNRLREFVRKERLLSVVGGQLKSTDAGKTLVVKRGAGVSSAPMPYSFQSKIMGALTASMLSGGITLGPFTRIEWAAITSASLTITVDDVTPKWFVWLSVDVREGAEAATWHEGADMATYYAGLTDDEKKYTAIAPLVEITATDKSDPPDYSAWSIDEVKNLQCGDVLIPRL